MVKKHKLKWFGHVSRSAGLAEKLYKEQCKEGEEGAIKRSIGRYYYYTSERTRFKFCDALREVEDKLKAARCKVLPQTYM